MKHNKMRKMVICSISLLSLLFVSACTSSTSEIKLSKTTIEYESETIDICKFIESVDTIKIKEHNRFKFKISQDGLDVRCPEKNVRKLGKQEVIIEVNGAETVVNFEVVDTTKPTIQTKDSYEVEEGNEYFDLSKLVDVSDNYDTDVILGFTGEVDVQKEGIYNIVVNAKDHAKNKTSKSIAIHVKGKEVRIEKVEIVKDVPESQSGQGQNGSAQQGGNPPQPVIPNTGGSVTEPTTPSLPAMRWLYADGYDQDSAFATCKSYRGNASGGCSPLRDAQGIPYGFEFIPY